ncbi:MAG: PAS domain S-box protein [Alphaproteobacteria bacterium]
MGRRTTPKDDTWPKRTNDADALLHSIIETSPDGLITIDEDGRILSFNPAAEAMFGFDADEVIGENINCLMPPPYRDAHDGYMKRYLRTGEKRIIGIGRQVLAKRKNGEVFPIDLAVGEVKLAADRRRFAGFIRDVSAREAAEQSLNQLRGELLHVSRLSELGEMASALAHELNQPLTAIINYLEACCRTLEQPDADRRQTESLMQKASDQAHRAGQIIQQLRKFITKGETERSAEAVNEVVREAADLALVGSQNQAVVTEFDLASDLPEIMIDRIQIQQVIMNLVRNSLDALTQVERRALTIRTRLASADSVQIDVIDSGPGLPKQVAERLFQPFVTTKSGGIGIGLSICKSIVDAHGGCLSTTPLPEGGTVFHIGLPVDCDGSERHG